MATSMADNNDGCLQPRQEIHKETTVTGLNATVRATRHPAMPEEARRSHADAGQGGRS
ncbi:hypothetical protein AEMCBJ_27660 [Cupriavidus necator]